MTDIAFPDSEVLLCAWLPDQTGVRTSVERPANLAEAPFIQVARVGGTDTDSRLDRALVSVDCYAPDRNTARELANTVRSLLLTSLRGRIGEAVVVQVQTVSAPSWRPYDNSNVRRYGATFRITLHS